MTFSTATPSRDNRLLGIIVAVLLGVAGAAVLITLAMADGPERTRVSQTLGSDASASSTPPAAESTPTIASVTTTPTIDTGPALERDRLAPVDPATVIAEPWPSTPPQVGALVAKPSKPDVALKEAPIVLEPVVVPAPAPKSVAKVAPAPSVAPLVEVVDSALGMGVEDRAPVGAASVFDTAADKVWAWVKVKNTGKPTTIQMVWRREGEVAATVSLKVGTSSGWRTWSNKNVHGWDIGEWEIDVIDANGTLVDTLSFDIVRAEHVEKS